MSKYLTKFAFEDPPTSIEYFDEEPLALNNELNFFHNKNKFRKYLNNLQYIFQEYAGNPLLASGIRDSYISEKLSEQFLIVLFTDNETIVDADKIVGENENIGLKANCFYLKSTSNYILLLSKDIEGLKKGISTMENIFKQVFEDYMARQNFEDFVKIKPFKILNCKK